MAGATALGAGLGAAGNVIGGLMDNLFAKRNARIQYDYQQKLNENQQKWNEKNMAIQNQYQIDQWNRENAYNDPSAVRQRYEAAAISPQAAFGQGAASGAGISGSLSSAPSGGMPSSSFSMPHVNSFGGLGDSIVQGMNAMSTAKRVDAENKYTEQQARKAKWENDVLNPILADLQTALKDEKVADATIKQIDSRFRSQLNELQVNEKTLSLGKLSEEARKINQEILNMESVKSLTDEQRKAVSKSIEEMDSRIVLNEMHTRLAREEANLANSKSWLTDAQTITEKMRNGDYLPEGLLKAQFEKILSDIGVQEHQKMHIDRMYEIAKQNSRNARRNNTSAETRKWILGIVNTVLSAYFAGMDSTDSSTYGSSSTDIGSYAFAD